MPTYRTRSEEHDEEIIKLTRALIRLEQDTRALQTMVGGLEKTAEGFKSFSSIVNALKIFAGILLVSAAGFVADGLRQREHIRQLQDQVLELKQNQEITRKQLETIGSDVRSMSTRLVTWIEAEEKRGESTERRIEKIESKRHR